MKKAFTLIELLIVVAIIAILAAIAVPNFLEAQTRAKVSRVKTDMRSVATALEAYCSDNNKYPPCRSGQTAGYDLWQWDIWRAFELTTPVAYMTSVNLPDPFRPNISGMRTKTQNIGLQYIEYQAHTDTSAFIGWARIIQIGNPNVTLHKAWELESFGPDRQPDGSAYMMWDYLGPNNGLKYGQDGLPSYPLATNSVYDATNGTVSHGDITRMGGEVPGSLGNVTR